jgi:glycosyltransferase involved in cell wall biosynthesis
VNRGVGLSVVIPVLNAGQDFERCLQALVSQTHPQEQYEVLVVDNGSTDDSIAIARRYPRITLILESECGPYAARNRGAVEARGDVIAFIDPDCIPNQDWLEQIATAMTEPATAVVLGRRSLPAGPVLALLEAYENAKDEFVLNSHIPTLYYGYTNNMAVRKKVFTDVGSFINRPRGADTIFVRRVVDAYSTHAVRYVPSVVVSHLEVSDLAVYYHKVFSYGRHRQLNNTITYAAALNTRQRLDVFRRAIHQHDLSAMQAATLLGVLAAGALAWQLGDAYSTFRRPFAR